MHSVDRDYGFKAWLVVLTASLFFFYVFFQINMFNALAPDLMRHFGVSATRLGDLSATYFASNVVCLFPAGMLLDRFSTRKIIIASMAVCVLATFFFSISAHYWQTEICHLAIGVAGAFTLISAVRLASRWFQPHRMALVVGLVVTMAMIGGVFAQTPLTILTDDVGWREAMQFNALFGLILLLLIVFIVRDYPKGHADIEQDQHAHLNAIGFWRSLRLTIANTQNWMCGIYTCMLNIPIMVLGSTWGSLYLMQAHGLTRDRSTLIVSMIFIGMIVGSPLVGLLSDTLRRRKMPMIVGAIICMIIVLIIMLGGTFSFTAYMVLFFLFGFAMSFQVISYPLIAESNSPDLTGTAEGLGSVLIMSSGFMIPIFPMLLNINWNNTLVKGVPVYSLSNYHTAMLMMPIAFVIAFIVSLLVKESNCKQLVTLNNSEK